MEALNSLGILLGSSWASGINMYLTIAGLGIASRMHWISLPGDMNALANPLIILVGIVMYVVEFVADKIPYVDSMWDSFHTFIRPVAGAALGYMATAHVGPVVQIPVALLTGAVSLNSHLAKATTRVAINTSPEPFSNSVASITEDVTVFGMLTLIIKHPIIASIVAIVLITLSVLLLIMMFKFLKKVFSFITGKGKQPLASETTKK
jgi:hypothetical protein